MTVFYLYWDFLHQYVILILKWFPDPNTTAMVPGNTATNIILG